MTTERSDLRQSATILVVDDEHDIITALTDLLEDDYTVVAAQSAAEGLRILNDRPEIALIISDQRMPGMTGDRFLAACREVTDAGAILLTGYADLSAVVDAVNREASSATSRSPGIRRR